MTPVPILQSRILKSYDLCRHGFFTRRGGVSAGEFSSLNCDRFSGDEPSHIEENRSRVARALSSHSMISLKQIHSSMVHVVDEFWDSRSVIEGDGLVTKEKGVALAIVGADCASVLFLDPVNQVIGAAHGGWKGAVSGITDTVVHAMCELGAQTDSLVASIGPTIQKQSYEVDVEFEQMFLIRSDIKCDDCFVPAVRENKRMFDLPLYLEKKIKTRGVGKVDRRREDTYTDMDRFYSYRRSCHRGIKSYGRQTGAISLIGA